MSTARFDAKVGLITGAASGIGRAIAHRLVSEGGVVFGVDVDEPGLEAMARDLGRPFRPHVADLSQPSVCTSAVAACIDALGRLDVLGNVAGIPLIEHLTDVTVEDYRRVMAINVDAPFFLSQSAIPYLLESGGNIVNLASSAALMGQAYTVVYCMSKSAVAQLTRSLAMEFVKTPVRVNAIAPGTTNTPLVRNVRTPADLDLDLMAPYVGFRPPAEPEEVAALFAYLASDDARSIHGAVLSIDNGVTAG